MLSKRDKALLSILKRIVKEEEYTIYTISNVITGKKYVGLTQDYDNTINNYKSRLKNGKYFNRQLQEDYDIYDESAFTFKVEAYCNNEKIAKLRQRYYVEQLKATNEDAVYNKQGFGSYKKKVMLDTIEGYIKIIQRLLVIVEEIQEDVKNKV